MFSSNVYKKYKIYGKSILCKHFQASYLKYK